MGRALILRGGAFGLAVAFVLVASQAGALAQDPGCRRGLLKPFIRTVDDVVNSPPQPRSYTPLDGSKWNIPSYWYEGQGQATLRAVTIGFVVDSPSTHLCYNLQVKYKRIEEQDYRVVDVNPRSPTIVCGSTAGGWLGAFMKEHPNGTVWAELHCQDTYCPSDCICDSSSFSVQKVP